MIRSAHHMEEKDVLLRAEYGQTDSFKIIRIRQEPMPFYRDSDKKAAKTSRISKNMFVLDTYFNLALKKYSKPIFVLNSKHFLALNKIKKTFYFYFFQRFKLRKGCGDGIHLRYSSPCVVATFEHAY